MSESPRPIRQSVCTDVDSHSWRRIAEADGVALNQFINVAVAENLSAPRTETYFAERATRADVPKAIALLNTAGGRNPPVKG